MAGRAGAQTAPASVAEGLGNALRELTSAMTAPDAIRYAGPLMQLQTMMLDLIHKTTGVPAAGTPGMPPGAAPGGAPGAAPGAPGGAPNLAMLGGAPGGPSGAGGPPSASPTGATAEMIRRLVAGAAAGQG